MKQVGAYLNEREGRVEENKCWSITLSEWVQIGFHSRHININFNSQQSAIQTHMFQSFSRNHPNHKLHLLCNKCKQKPSHQFVLLLCDHVICGPCLQDYVQIRQNQYEGIRCPCGVITYFKTAEDGLPEWDPPEPREGKRTNNISVNIHNTSANWQERGSRKTSNRPSVGLIQSKNTTSTKNLSRINTEALGFNQSARLEPIDQRQDKFMLQKSKYPVRNTDIAEYFSPISGRSDEMKMHVAAMTPQPTRKSKNQCSSATNLHYCPKFIDSENVTEVQASQKQNLNPNKTHDIGKKLHQDQRLESSDFSDSGSSPQFKAAYQSSISSRPGSKQKHNANTENQLSSEIKSELKYLKVTHKKNMEALERAYQQARQKISEDYKKLENNIKDFCLEILALGQAHSQVNVGKIISMRYDTYIGSRIEKLTSQIKKYSIDKNGNPFEYGETISNPRNAGCALSPINISDRQVRWTNPQPYRESKLHTEPAALYETKGEIRRFPNDRDQHLSKYSNQMGRVAGNQNGSKLQKRTTKRKTNIIIQL